MLKELESEQEKLVCKQSELKDILEKENTDLEKYLDYVEYQISSLASERLSYVDCQKEYDRLYAQKKEELIKGAGETAQKILEITDSLNLASINLKEVKEAIFVGKKVLDSLCSQESMNRRKVFLM